MPTAPAERDEEGASPETKPFLEHLEDLRRTLIECIAALVAGMALAGPFAPRIFGWLQRPLERATGLADPFLRSAEQNRLHRAGKGVRGSDDLDLTADVVGERDLQMTPQSIGK